MVSPSPRTPLTRIPAHFGPFSVTVTSRIHPRPPGSATWCCICLNWLGYEGALASSRVARRRGTGEPRFSVSLPARIGKRARGRQGRRYTQRRK